jgi:polyphosphate kinase
MGFFTCKEAFASDGSMLFNLLTGYTKTVRWQKIATAPQTLKAVFLRLIETEAAHARSGQACGITAKMNALSDTDMIMALYRASNAGVPIRLMVRGICCLLSGVPGQSENIEVSSVVDRFLEHDRMYSFVNGGSVKVFLSSADWMPRNLDRRVEILFPIEEAALKARLLNNLSVSLSDDARRRVQQPDGTYKKVSTDGKAVNRSQYFFYHMAEKAYQEANEEKKLALFRPKA